MLVLLQYSGTLRETSCGSSSSWVSFPGEGTYLTIQIAFIFVATSTLATFHDFLCSRHLWSIHPKFYISKQEPRALGHAVLDTELIPVCSYFSYLIFFYDYIMFMSTYLYIILYLYYIVIFSNFIFKLIILINILMFLSLF